MSCQSGQVNKKCSLLTVYVQENPCGWLNVTECFAWRVRYLSKGSSSNHLEDLEIFFVKAHLLHFGCKRFGCEEKKKKYEG